jgi:predicted dehydrogenase
MSIWLIGTGQMAMDYAKVLNTLGKEYIVIGRGAQKAKDFEEAFGKTVFAGGLDSYLLKDKTIPEFVINAVGIDKLTEVTTTLLKHGCKNILVEKPGVAYANEVDGLAKFAKNMHANVYLAYNRRFYQSVLVAKKIIEEDGGVQSFNFEFTEWAHQIEGIKHLKTQEELQNWFLGNSTHVIDLAFYLGGNPKEMASFVSGKDQIEWHTKSSNYSGAGISNTGALFSYHANWKSPGRFSVEILTHKHRLIFRPLEKLQIQNIGSVAINFVDGIDYSYDENYKPGLFLQTKAFLENNTSEFINIQEQQSLINSFYLKMSGY